MKPLLVIKTGTAPAEVASRRGDFEDWIIQRLGEPDPSVQLVRVDLGQALPPAYTVRGALVTGSSAMVSDHAAWSERTGSWLLGALAQRLPILGICYGHQLLAHALGARVGPNPRGRQIGTVAATLTKTAWNDPLLGQLPSPLAVQTSHVESALTLPPGARLLATTELDPHHAFAVDERCWGVQFHPEFDADIVRGYIDVRRDVLAREGHDPDRLQRDAFDTPHGEAILRRFARICRP